MRRGEDIASMLFTAPFYLFVVETESHVFVYIHFLIEILFFLGAKIRYFSDLSTEIGINLYERDDKIT